ncbi:MAG: tRNA (adenosine(37)-N6)-threonylcarbamoyltransferase complex ATPase subunit type 1 TsaE [Bacteroidetes bacterium]|nr:tRNA (adenosine(37)-N6)-threonylcarbamoyltransferase complex ATPase subunit type 1 TsaE [Bacteroidota bacterium]
MKKSSLYCSSIRDLDDIAGQVLTLGEGLKIFAVSGDLGAGKTTLIRAICRKLSVIDFVVSPTFSIINEYESPVAGRIYHFDFYRVKRVREILDLGYEEYFFSGNYCFIEWPEKFRQLLPPDFVQVAVFRENEPGSAAQTPQEGGRSFIVSVTRKV